METLGSGRSPQHRSIGDMSDITKKSDRQKGAEAAVEGFRKDLGPFVVAAETTRMAMLFTDAAKPDIRSFLPTTVSST
jgi:hypothetical protein